MTALLLAIALMAPLAGALAVVAVRPDGLLPGRIVAVSGGIAACAALVLLAVSASTADALTAGPIGLDFQLDRAAAMLLATVLCTGVVVASFARRNVDVDERAMRFFALFGVLVTGSALIVVPGPTWMLAGGWVASTWAFLGLIGHDDRAPATAVAQRRAARALVAGDVALVAAILVAAGGGGLDVARSAGGAVDELRESTLLGTSRGEIVALLLIAAGISRSSLIPFHRWLVATLAAPTPVSALVHAGFVSGAGLLMIRFDALMLDSDVALYLALVAGATSAVVAVGAASTRVDVKGKLAWSTVSQMGFMVVQCAVGAFSSAVVHIIGHGMYKATMFLGAGEAISAGLDSKRRAVPMQVPSRATRLATSAIIATVAVAIGMVVVPPDVTNGGVVLIALFAWLTIANGVWGWVSRPALGSIAAVASAFGGALVSVFAYLGGLRLIEAFLEPEFGGVAPDAGVAMWFLVAVLVVIGVITAIIMGSAAAGTEPPGRVQARAWLTRAAHPGVAGLSVGAGWTSFKPSAQASSARTDVPSPIGLTEQSQIRADVARAQTAIAPSWPLTSFVAVNPLGGLERNGFDAAAATARRELRARTHLSLDDYRSDHARGLSSIEDLRWAIAVRHPELCNEPPVTVAGKSMSVADIIELDLLHGPEADEVFAAQTALERFEGVRGPVGALIDKSLTHSAAQYVAADHVANGIGSGEQRSFADQWQEDALSIAEFRRVLSAEARAWLSALGDNSAQILGESLRIAGVDDGERVEELRGHLVRLRGWTGFARWRTEWAHPGESRPMLSPLDLAAARCALEAAWLRSHTETPVVAATSDADAAATAQRHDRAVAILDSIGLRSADPAAHRDVAAVLDRLPADGRHAVWLTAQERKVHQELLGQLDRLDPGRRLDVPSAQLAFCIDVRSEGLRRHLEAAGPYETTGFAGFFGVPLSVRRLEWNEAEARCPVLVAPSVPAVERPRDHDVVGAADLTVEHTGTEAAALLGRSRRGAAATAVHTQTKKGPGAPFTMAEAAGWLVGPIAAARTLLPVPGRYQKQDSRPTVMEIDRSSGGGVAPEQRVDFAEAVLRTMGLIDRFASLVVLCGHRSQHLNNPHATALDCGACAGASGEDNARAVAALLNESAVRAGLRTRNIDIPDGTHFMPGLHETVSDRVTLLDREDLPERHLELVDQLEVDLERAAEAQSAQRARHLPGPIERVRSRGTDWAQVRPEWGLANNAAFIIGPRSMTTGLDLEGRAFLHDYDAESDPEGKTLETIMTAPLVVAHWISSQYYFSTVDPEVFGAGDKLMHNIIGDVGVLSGEHGDLRVGLPLQSTHRGAERHHQPVRLLAVVQAPLDRIERIIQQNPVLKTLIGGSWLHIAGRSHPHERWSMRTPGGTWSAEPRPIEHNHTLEPLEQS